MNLIVYDIYIYIYIYILGKNEDSLKKTKQQRYKTWNDYKTS